MFKEYLETFNILTSEEVNNILNQVNCREIKKSDFFVKQGSTCKEVAFVSESVFRTFYVSAKGEEITYCIAFPGGLITAYSSFITGNVTQENIQAINHAKIYVLKKKVIEDLSERSGNWTKFLKVMAEQQYIELENRIFQLQKRDAVYRYRDLLTTRPEYIKHIPLQYLASFLGIAQRHLSRIRKEIF